MDAQLDNLLKFETGASDAKDKARRRSMSSFQLCQTYLTFCAQVGCGNLACSHPSQRELPRGLGKTRRRPPALSTEGGRSKGDMVALDEIRCGILEGGRTRVRQLVITAFSG
ncbi:hypothetical protein LIA77_02056 [Sarocladium implicatum]|nr:hypothetical protein LIA77_02056 [Sarocladium implicatum]